MMQSSLPRLAGMALAGAALLAAGSAFAQQKLVPEQSEIVFVSKQMGVPVEGRFKKFDAQVASTPPSPPPARWRSPWIPAVHAGREGNRCRVAQARVV